MFPAIEYQYIPGFPERWQEPLLRAGLEVGRRRFPESARRPEIATSNAEHYLITLDGRPIAAVWFDGERSANGAGLCTIVSAVVQGDVVHFIMMASGAKSPQMSLYDSKPREVADEFLGLHAVYLTSMPLFDMDKVADAYQGQWRLFIDDQYPLKPPYRRSEFFRKRFFWTVGKVDVLTAPCDGVGGRTNCVAVQNFRGGSANRALLREISGKIITAGGVDITGEIYGEAVDESGTTI